MVLVKPIDAASKDTKSILNSKYRYQLLVTLTIQIFTFAHGIATGWTSPTIHKLQSENSPTNFTITVEQVSWIGSLYGLGSLTGNILYGIIINRIGRKWCMYLMAVPFMSAWVLIYFSKTYVYIYIARYLGGLTAGSNYVVVPIFISEIADRNIRGALSVMAMLFLSFGFFVGFVISSHLDYYVNPFIIISLPIVYLLLIVHFPETPQHLLRKKQIEKARKSFYFYHRISEPVKQLECSDCPNYPENLEFQELKGNIEKSYGKMEKLKVSDFVNSNALKAFCTAFVLMVLNQLTGSYALMNYMSDVFAYSGTDIDPNTCTIVMGAAQIVGTLCATFLVDRCGRRVILLTSSGGYGICLAIFGLYLQFTTADIKLQFNWIPLVIMTVAIICSSCGILGLIFTVVVETLPTKIRDIGTSMAMSIMSTFIFVALKIFPLFMHTYGLANLLYTCFGVCAICWTYLFIFQKETNGKSMDK